jgi:hypothetical protein
MLARRALLLSARPNSWDPSVLTSDWALSNGNLTGTHSGTTGSNLRGTRQLGSGQPYFTVTGTGTTTNILIGMCKSTANLAAGIGFDSTNSFGIAQNGAVWINGATGGRNVGFSINSGDSVSVKYFPATQVIQARKNGNAFGSDVDISSMSPGFLYPAFNIDVNGFTAVGDFTTWTAS